MVSLRRRRLLGLCSGLPNPMYFDDEGVAQFGTNPANTLPLASSEKKQNKEIANSSSTLASTSSYQELHDQPFPDQEEKLRRQQRRKHTHEQERRVLRGVYFKNMKWQAAIKVDKKQIHLGTVGSQAEATRLYDRAAFMCGREPNLELPEEEKRELKRLEWDEFLEKTRLQLCSKIGHAYIVLLSMCLSDLILNEPNLSEMRRRRFGSGSQEKSELSLKELCSGGGAEGALATDLEEDIF